MLRSVVAALGASTVASLAVPTAFASPLPRPGSTEPSVRISVATMSPRDITERDNDRVLSLSGHITNTSSVPLESLRLRVQRGPVITTRSELHQSDDADTTSPVVRSCQWQNADLRDGLRPGADVAFSYHCDLDSLGMTLIGIYPLVLRAEAGTADLPGHQTAGEVRTFLPSFPQGVTARTQVNWLWPLVDRPHRLTGNDEFLDDDLGRTVSPGGRLDRMLAMAEDAPKGVQLTLVVDPALVDALGQMEHGYQVRSGSHWVPGRYGAAATGWLDRLRHLAARYPVAALPYGDPDVVALRRVGLADLARITPADRALINDRLGVAPVTTLAWPPGGVVTPEALTALVDQGVQAVVLDHTALPGQPVSGATPSSVTRLHTPSRTQAVALVPDPDVSATVRESRGYPEGPRLAEQRYLAELAMITAETPSKGRELVVAPPRRWDPDPASASAMLAATATTSWLAPGSAAELAHHLPEVDRGPLVYPVAARRSELPRDLVAGLGRLRSQVDDFRSAPLDPRTADQMVTPYARAVRLAASSAWRAHPGDGTRYVAELRSQVATLRAGVHIVKPSGSGVYVLASSNSPLILTVANDLPDAVRFRVSITSRGTPGFTVGDIGEQVIQGRTRRTIQIPARVERSGLFVVNALVTTPAGQALGVDGQPVRLKVRSTAYGLIGLVITGIALALLLLLIIRRLVIRIRRDPGTGRTNPQATPTPPERGRPGYGTDGTNGYGEDPTADATLDATLGAHPACIPAPAERSTV